MDGINLIAGIVIGLAAARWLEHSERQVRISGRRLREMAQYETHRWN